MEEIINQIDKIKQMQQFPRYYLTQYFDELKAQVDTKYALKLDEKDKYLEIINNIESFEQDVYNKWNSKTITTFENEISLIEEKMNNNLTDITKLIDELKHQIEKKIFSNKSILFFDIEESNCSFASNSFLLIINDEYISKSCINCDLDHELVTVNELNDFILKEKIKNINLKSINILNLNIGIINLKEINLVDKNIKEIHPNLFNPAFEPTKVFLIIYDNVLASDDTGVSTSKVSFQIALSSDSFKKSYVTFKYSSCPTDFSLRAPSGLNLKNDGFFEEVKIEDDQQCTGSNVGQAGVWVSEVTLKRYSKSKLRKLFKMDFSKKCIKLFMLQIKAAFVNPMTRKFGCKFYLVFKNNFFQLEFFMT